MYATAFKKSYPFLVIRSLLEKTHSTVLIITTALILYTDTKKVMGTRQYNHVSRYNHGSGNSEKCLLLLVNGNIVVQKCIWHMQSLGILPIYLRSKNWTRKKTIVYLKLPNHMITLSRLANSTGKSGTETIICQQT